MPLPDLPQRYHELPKGKLVVLLCHHGNRSMRALQFLRGKGYTNLKNVAGGINAWAKRSIRTCRNIEISVQRSTVQG